jgi:hypothetical protein
MTSTLAITPVIATKLDGMGILDMDKALQAGSFTVADVFAVVQARIDKRTALGERQLPRIVEYRNKLVAAMNSVSPSSIPAMEVPTYSKKVQPSTSLPTDPNDMADVIVATVGLANVGAVISRLTARVMGL